MIEFKRLEKYNAIRSANVVITYRVMLDGKHVGTIKHKHADGWRYHPRGGTPGKAFQDVTACMRSLA